MYPSLSQHYSYLSADISSAQRPPRESPTPPSASTNEKKKTENGSALLFITGNKPADFKARGVMTQVRKQAMDSYLKKEKRPRKNKTGSRKQSEDAESQASTRGSVGSEEQDVVDAVISSSDALSMYYGDRRRKPTSSIPSPASSGRGNDRQTATPDIPVLRIPPVLDMVLSSAPIVQPMRTGIPLLYMQTSPRPFQSIGKPLDPFRTLFQAHHPAVSVEELKFHCTLFASPFQRNIQTHTFIQAPTSSAPVPWGLTGSPSSSNPPTPS